MKIESFDFFYLKMPEVLDIGDGSQDALLVRIRAGGYEGWGECEASPLTSIASYICPMSHSACKPVAMAVEGMTLRSVEDIEKIGKKVHSVCFDLLQADHTLSGIDIACWDLLGKYLKTPVYSLLGYAQSYPKLPYASQLFGTSPQETYQKAVLAKKAGFRAVKFGWGPFGVSLGNDQDHLVAARQGLGQDIHLMVDAGTIWETDVEEAERRLKMLHDVNAYWLEEPFANLALLEYKTLSQGNPQIPLAGGEGCNNFLQAAAMLHHGGLQFIQIDTGRIGGITPAKRVADLALKRKIKFVNHTFTSHLALSASLQPFAGIEHDVICEYPFEPKALAREISKNAIPVGKDGLVNLDDKPGLGVEVDIYALGKYLVDVEIYVEKKLVYQTPSLLS